MNSHLFLSCLESLHHSCAHISSFSIADEISMKAQALPSASVTCWPHTSEASEH